MRMKLIAICVFVGMVASLQGHPGHDSVTQAVYRSETGLLEVTVSVHLADLEKALSHQSGKKEVIEVAESETLDQRILAYVQDRFLLESTDGRRLEFSWVGREMGESNSPHHADGEIVLLHFEAPLTGGLDKLRVRQGVFCEFNDDQINLVHLRDEDRKLTLGFGPQHGVKTVAFK